jgi:hypothetical protein
MLSDGGWRYHSERERRWRSVSIRANIEVRDEGLTTAELFYALAA